MTANRNSPAFRNNLYCLCVTSKAPPYLNIERVENNIIFNYSEHVSALGVADDMVFGVAVLSSPYSDQTIR